MQGKPSVATLAWLAFGVAPILAGCLFWAGYSWGSRFAQSYRNHTLGVAAPMAGTAASSPKSLKTAGVEARADKVPSDETTAPVDPDPFADFQQFVTLPNEPARGALQINPGKLRAIVDRGVVAYASARTEADRAKGASLIQTAALVGWPAARVLLARNYPQSEAVRSVVPANDVIRYALAALLDPVSEGDESKQIFLALGQHFALHGQLDLFAYQILNSLRGDQRPRLSHRIDILLDQLERIPGYCTALARRVAAIGDASDQECSPSLSEKLRRYIETATSAGEEAESKRRGVSMLNQLGSH